MCISKHHITMTSTQFPNYPFTSHQYITRDDRDKICRFLSDNASPSRQDESKWVRSLLSQSVAECPYISVVCREVIDKLLRDYGGVSDEQIRDSISSEELAAQLKQQTKTKHGKRAHETDELPVDDIDETLRCLSVNLDSPHVLQQLIDHFEEKKCSLIERSESLNDESSACSAGEYFDVMMQEMRILANDRFPLEEQMRAIFLKYSSPMGFSLQNDSPNQFVDACEKVKLAIYRKHNTFYHADSECMKSAIEWMLAVLGEIEEDGDEDSRD